VSLSLVAAVNSDVGLVREGNEDSAFVGPRLIAVADGMGGHAAGEVASRVAIDYLMPLDEDVAGADILGALREALEEANAHLRDMVAKDARLEGMGTTVTALLSSGRRLGLVHIGDSRAYLLRDGKLDRITRDHTYVQELVDAGQITEDEVATHPQRSLILRALQGHEPIEPDLRVREAVLGDRYLLCSDGLTGVVSDTTLKEVLAGTPGVRDAVERLVALALKGGGPDNVTVVVADVVEHGQQTTPELAGAAAESNARPSATARMSAAGRAALTRARRAVPPATDTDTPGGTGTADATGTAGATGTPAATPRPAWRTRLLRPLVAVPIVVLVLAVAVGLGTVAYLRSQWYVGVDAGKVTVFRGVPGSFVGLHLSSVQSHLDPVEDYIDGEQMRLAEGITTGSRSGAEAIIAALKHKATPLAPSVTPTGTAVTPVTPVPASPAPPRPPGPIVSTAGSPGP